MGILESIKAQRQKVSGLLISMELELPNPQNKHATTTYKSMLKSVSNRTPIAIRGCSLAAPDFAALFPSVGTFHLRSTFAF